MMDTDVVSFAPVSDRFSPEDTADRLVEAKEQYLRDQTGSTPYSGFGTTFLRVAWSIISEPELLCFGLVMGVVLDVVIFGTIAKAGWMEGETLWICIFIFPILILVLGTLLGSYFDTDGERTRYLKEREDATRTLEHMSPSGLLVTALAKVLDEIDRRIHGSGDETLAFWSTKLVADAKALDTFAATLQDGSDNLDLVTGKADYLRSLLEESTSYIKAYGDLRTRRDAWAQVAEKRETALAPFTEKGGALERQLISEGTHETVTGCLEIEAEADSLIRKIDDLIVRMQTSDAYIPEDVIED